MAALLCETLSLSCDKCCERLLSPFKVVGDACRTCGDYVRIFARVLCSPFLPYLLVTAVLNLPPTLWSFQGYKSTCTLSWWLWINGPLCICHVVASYYVVYQIQQQFSIRDDEDVIDLTDAEEGHHTVKTSTTAYQTMKDEETTVQAVAVRANPVCITTDGRVVSTTTAPKTPVAITAEGGVTTAATSTSHSSLERNPMGSLCTRLSRVLCYDAGVALYILAALLWVGWQTLGMAVIFRVGGNFEDDVCHVKRRIFLSLTCGWLYAMLVSVTFASSFLCVRQI